MDDCNNDTQINNTGSPDKTLYNKAQLVLAEKRTSLAVLRTGIMIFALPLTVLTALIAFSRFYDFDTNIWLFIPVVIVSTILFVVGLFLMYRAFTNIMKFDRMLEELRHSDPVIRSLIPKSDTKILH